LTHLCMGLHNRAGGAAPVSAFDYDFDRNFP
jgi:hypothetical protein